MGAILRKGKDMELKKLYFDGKIREIPTQEIEVINTRNRESKKFKEIVESIKREGMLKPIVVNDQHREETGKYQLLCGEGRLLACKELGYKTILAEVISCDPQTGYVVSLVENMARTRYTTLELARLIHHLHQKGMTIQELSRITGRSMHFVTEYIRLIEQGEEKLIKAVEEHRLPIYIAARISAAKDEGIQGLLMEAFQQNLMTAREVSAVQRIIESRKVHGKRLTDKGIEEPGDGEAKGEEIPSTLEELKKDFQATLKQQEEYITRIKKLEQVVALLDGYIEIILEDGTFKELLHQERIQIPRKYKKIFSSIRHMGLIEALSVYEEGGQYYLLDGYLRLHALEELGEKKVPWFVYQSRDSYTFNAMRNEIAPLQENRMLRKALASGISEEELARIFGVKPISIHRDKIYTGNLIPEVARMLDNNEISRTAAEQFNLVNQARQYEMLEKMREVGDFTASYAKLLVMKTPERMLVNQPKQWRKGSSKARKKTLYTQIRKGAQEIEFLSSRYKENMKDLMQQVMFFRSVMENQVTAGYLRERFPEVVKQVQALLAQSAGSALLDGH